MTKVNASFHEFVKRLHAHRLLSSVPLFSMLDDKALERLNALFKRHEVKAGEVLADEGQIADRLIVLLEGDARSFRPGHDEAAGRERVLSHGDHIGSEGLLTITRHGRSAAMTTDGSIAVLDKQDFIRLVRRTPSIAMNLPGMSTLKVTLPFFFD